MTRLSLCRILRNIILTIIILLVCNQCVTSVGFAGSNDELKDIIKKMSVLEISANEIRGSGEGETIFEGKVRLRYDNVTDFYADKMVIAFFDRDKLKHIEMLGNVEMERLGLKIYSQRAFSDDFRAYLDFADNITVIQDGAKVKHERLRYHFPLGKLEKEVD